MNDPLLGMEHILSVLDHHRPYWDTVHPFHMGVSKRTLSAAASGAQSVAGEPRASVCEATCELHVYGERTYATPQISVIVLGGHRFVFVDAVWDMSLSWR